MVNIGWIRAAQNVRIEHAEHMQTQQTSSYSKQSGLTVALSGGVVDAAQTAVSAAQAAGNSNNSRLAALQGVKTPQERALLLATYNEQVRDINTATAQFEKLGPSASVIDVFMTQTAQILPDLALSVGGNGRPALAVKPVAGGQTVGVESAPAAVGQPPVSAGGRVGAVVESVQKPELASANGSIVSASQAARLHMQLSAEQAAGVRAPTQIISYSDHAIAQMASRDYGAGVNKAAVTHAFSNPVAIQYVPSKYGPTFRYIGQDATVVVNAEGKVVTAWATNSSGVAK